MNYCDCRKTAGLLWHILLQKSSLLYDLLIMYRKKYAVCNFFFFFGLKKRTKLANELEGQRDSYKNRNKFCLFYLPNVLGQICELHLTKNMNICIINFRNATTLWISMCTITVHTNKGVLKLSFLWILCCYSVNMN